MLVFNNKVMCFNSSAVNWTEPYNWKDIHPSFIKSQTKNSAYDLSAVNCGGLIVHLDTTTTAYQMVSSAINGTWMERYSDKVPICYYSASNTPFVEPTELMQKKYKKPDELIVCDSKLYRNEETFFNENYHYSIKYSLPANFYDAISESAGYYVFDDSFLRRNNIPYIIEFTTRPKNSSGSGCAVWMGNLPYEYTPEATYCCLNRCTFSSINNVNIKINNSFTGGTINLFAAGGNDDSSISQSNITGLNNVNVYQNGSRNAARFIPNSNNITPGSTTEGYGYLSYCNNVSSNKTLYCEYVGTATNCTNLVTGTN